MNSSAENNASAEICLDGQTSSISEEPSNPLTVQMDAEATTEVSYPPATEVVTAEASNLEDDMEVCEYSGDTMVTGVEKITEPSISTRAIEFMDEAENSTIAKPAVGQTTKTPAVVEKEMDSVSEEPNSANSPKNIENEGRIGETNVDFKISEQDRNYERKSSKSIDAPAPPHTSPFESKMEWDSVEKSNETENCDKQKDFPEMSVKSIQEDNPEIQLTLISQSSEIKDLPNDDSIAVIEIPDETINISTESIEYSSEKSAPEEINYKEGVKITSVEVESLGTKPINKNLDSVITDTGNAKSLDSKSESNKTESMEEEKPTNSNCITDKKLKAEKQNVIDQQNSAKKDESNAKIPNQNELDAQNSDDDVQFEKPNIMVIEIDDDDEDEDQLAVNVNKSESSSLQTVRTPKETETEKDESMVASKSVANTNTSTESISEDIEMKEDASPAERSQNFIKDANTEDLLVETTNATSAASKENDDQPLSADTSGEVFYNKECVNYECARNHKQFFRAPLFALSFYKIAKKKFKPQFICADCYDQSLEMYEEFSNLLAAKQPLLLKDVVAGRQEFVEIIDSSDEEDQFDKIDKSKDQYFSKSDIQLIENELENSIRRVLEKVEIQNQLTWSKTILASRAKALEDETNYIDKELRLLQKKADQMHVSLYQCPKIKVRQLQPLDLNTGRPYATADVEVTLPPIGEIHRPPIRINEVYYAVKNKAIASWVPCKVIEQVESPLMTKTVTHYRIKFLKSQYQAYKTVSVKHLAYFEAPNVRLPIGSRVIAYFDATSLSRGKEKMMIQSAFYPGIIAEPLKPNNKYRYLIFYDDGYTQYVYHKDVRLVCNVSDNVWEDVHPGSRDFIQKYLTQYSINRPMVQTQKGQSMTTESNGKWIYARVVDIDCSLIQMQFEGPKSHTEWIYRGSMRLGPVFKEHQKTMQKTTMPISRLPRRTEPFIRYTEDEEATTNQQQQQQRQQQFQQQQQQQPQQQTQSEPRAVAKKSVSRQESQTTSQQFSQVPVVRHLNNSTIYLEDENKPKGKVVYYTAKRNLPPQTYKPHTCSPNCLYKITHNLSAYSPLSKPLLSGWERLIIRQKIKKVVTYRGPCGKILRNMKELRNYLRVTKNVLNVENFDFSPETNCLAEYVIESAIVQKRDISNGQEKMAIPLVNYYDNTMPPECKYSAQRIPTEGVNLNVDEEFLVGCDCEDDCSDKTKCSCWQLTYAGAKYGNPNTPIEEIGYQYKRLYEHVPTGIYECNPRCKCKSNCLNRVVQHSLEMKLQVFKTSNRGWGLRCINDVPRGSFMCVYAGHLLTEAKANEGGLDAGDEYFAELDYIEVAEQIKEGYESDVETPEPEEEDELYDQDEQDDEFTPSKPHNTRSKVKQQKTTRSSSLPQGTDEDSQERQMINFNPNAIMDENSMRESSIRKLFGNDEACYVMDAKVTGNLGRYFNHSCSPNLFVQNVFVDTHDLRFPWVAFFALTHIRAGTELTWNYNYEVGVVPGKVLYCQCGAPNCRLRLL